MKSRSFGLDIGNVTSKAVWLSREREGFLLEAVMTAPTPTKGMLSESTLDQEEMSRSIKKLVQDGNIQSRSVNIALPESQVYTKVVDMPVLSDKELSSAIYWEAEQYIPVPLATITLDYSVLRRPTKPEDGGKMQVLLVGAPTRLITKYEKIITLAGLAMDTVETEILSVARALIIGEKFPTSLIVHIGALSTSLAIVKEGMIVFTYVIPTGGTAISRAIATDFGFSMEQAEEYKKVYGVSDKSLGGKIGKATEPILLSILGEIKKSFVYYTSKYRDDTIKQILISGGSAKLPGLTTYFTQAVGVETAIANPWKSLASQEVPKDIIDNAPEYTIAVGLAMKEYE